MTEKDKIEKQRALLSYLEEYLSEAYSPSSVDCGGHDVTHIYRLCAIAEKIIPDNIDLFLLKVAIWLHNLDRSSHPKLGDAPNNPEPFIRRILDEYPAALDSQEVDMVIDAVLKHSRPNEMSDSPLLIALKDCDRLDLIGTGSIGIIRMAQYRHKFPLYYPTDFDPHQPSRKPNEVATVVQQIIFCLEFESMLRLPKAKEYVKGGVSFLKNFLAMCQRTHNQLFLN